MVHDDIVKYVVDEKHPLLAVRVIPTVAQNRVRYALGKKNYSLLAEKNKLWNVSVKRGSQRITIVEHMTLPEVAEWVKSAKKLTTEDIAEMFEKNNVNEAYKAGGSVVPDEMAKYFGAVEDDVDAESDKSLEDAATQEDAEKSTSAVFCLINLLPVGLASGTVRQYALV